MRFLSLWGYLLFVDGKVKDIAVNPGESHKCCPLWWTLPLFLLWFEIEIAIGTVKGDVESEKVGIAMEAFLALGTIHIVNLHYFHSLKFDIVLKTDFFQGLRRKCCPR